MATRLKEVDAVMVGMGWTGSIMARELTKAGLTVVGLERGGDLTPGEHFALPGVRDELKYFNRLELIQDPALETITFRHRPSETALPMRRMGSFLPGNSVGGAANHWGGLHWRYHPTDHLTRSHIVERYGAKAIPEDMTIQDWAMTYDELEPYYDKFEKLCGTSGKAGNLRGQKIEGGNIFEGPRQNDYPTPPLKMTDSALMFEKAAKELGYHPFPQPISNASRAYTNPEGLTLGACQYCGFCERTGCEANAKAGPHVCIMPKLREEPKFTLRTRSWVSRLAYDKAARKVTGVVYTDTRTGEEYEQPASLVVLSAYVFGNISLMFHSGIGEPYDPAAQKGVIGKNYCYQTGVNARLFFEDKYFHPFMSAGGSNVTIDDFNINWGFDRGPHGFVGAYNVGSGFNTALPIGYRPVPAGTPQWGKAWKAATAKWYQKAMNINASGSVMANRYNYYDLDPIYRNAFGQPLMRMTFDYKENEHKLGRHSAELVNAIARSMNPASVIPASARVEPWTVVPYQSTHNTGGTIMGTNPKNSALNKYLQSWDCHNLFVVGANVFPHNSSYNPTGPVGALAYWAADAIKRYVKNPGPMVQA
ncbi:MAG: GMC family oxidoreductase [Xanthobacteraceae bacterium]